MNLNLAKGRELLTSAVVALVAPFRAWRRREAALALLLLFAVFVYLPLRLTFGAGGGHAFDASVLEDKAPVVRLVDVDPQGELQFPTPPYIVTGPSGTAGNFNSARNPFGFGVPPTPPPPPPTPPPPPPPTPPPPPPPTPTPYDCPFTLIGLAQQPAKEGGKRIAFLKGKTGDDITVALEGDELKVKGADGRTTRHRVKKIGIESVQMCPTEGDSPAQTLTFAK